MLALFLIFMNAFFVAAEFGMVKLRQTRVAVIKKKYGIRLISETRYSRYPIVLLMAGLFVIAASSASLLQ